MRISANCVRASVILLVLSAAVIALVLLSRSDINSTGRLLVVSRATLGPEVVPVKKYVPDYSSPTDWTMAQSENGQVIVHLQWDEEESLLTGLVEGRRQFVRIEGLSVASVAVSSNGERVALCYTSYRDAISKLVIYSLSKETGFQKLASRRVISMSGARLLVSPSFDEVSVASESGLLKSYSGPTLNAVQTRQSPFGIPLCYIDQRTVLTFDVAKKGLNIESVRFYSWSPSTNYSEMWNEVKMGSINSIVAGSYHNRNVLFTVSNVSNAFDVFGLSSNLRTYRYDLDSRSLIQLPQRVHPGAIWLK